MPPSASAAAGSWWWRTAPTVTHGDMPFGAGVIAAQRFGAAALVDPRPHLVGSLQETFAAYPRIGTLLPAMGYGEGQVRDLEATINNTPCDLVVSATPVDLTRLMSIAKTRGPHPLHVPGPRSGHLEKKRCSGA